MTVMKDGTPVGLAPRQVLKRILELYRQEGWQPIIAPELEFYLLQRNPDPNQPLQPPIGVAGPRRAQRYRFARHRCPE